MSMIELGNDDHSDPEFLSDAEILAHARAMREAGDIAGLLYLNTVLLIGMSRCGTGRMHLFPDLRVAGMPE